MKYNKLDWGTMEAIVNKLGGMQGVRTFLAGMTEVTVKPIKPTGSVTLGKRKDVEEYFQFMYRGYQPERPELNDFLKELPIEISEVEYKFNFVSMSLKKLGFKENATYAEITTAAESLGLKYCPTETALAICEQCVWVYSAIIFMKPILSDGTPIILSGGYTTTDAFKPNLSEISLEKSNDYFPPDCVFVFALD